MRKPYALLALFGCGPVTLGSERGAADEARDDRALTLAVSVTPDCSGCFVLHAEALGGRAPYTFLWDDGSADAERRVCAPRRAESVTVVAEDAEGHRSAEHSATLSANELAECPPRAVLCLENPSFEGKPAANSGLFGEFDADPWDTCSTANAANTPDIISDTVQDVVLVPVPTEGSTYVGIAEGEEVSQTLCEPLPSGADVFVLLDLSRFELVGVSELPYLEIWASTAASCTARELLWASERLETGFRTYCAPLSPTGYTDRLTLRARADDAMPTLAYLLVDNLRVVDRCP